MASIQGIYIALFGRPADPAGLAYFNSVTKNGADLSAINNLAGTAEYQNRFSGLANESIVNSIYQSLFGRNGETSGIAFWVAKLQSGALNINNIAIAILDGAQGSDLATVNAKIAAADLFTSHVDTNAEIGAYSGNNAAQIARDYITTVTTTSPGTSNNVDSVIARIVLAAGGQGPAGGGDTATTNTPATFSGTDTGTVKEDGGVIKVPMKPPVLEAVILEKLTDEGDGLQTASGTLTVTDPDSNETGMRSGTTAGTYGSLTIDSAGAWTYTLNNKAENVQALKEGQTVTDSIVVRSIDNTAHTITITVQGTNDRAQFSGSSEGSVTEDGEVLKASGKLTVSDVDTGEASFQAATNLEGSYGTLSIDADGNWTYDLNNKNEEVQALGRESSLSDSISVFSADGTSHQITITINGTNDEAKIGGTIAGAVTEDNEEFFQATGTLTISDVDLEEASFQATDEAPIAGKYGSLTITSNGEWTYTIDNTKAEVQALAKGETAEDVIEVKALDGTVQKITVTVTGTNDAAKFSGDSTGSVTEDAEVTTATGTLVATDVDNGEVGFKEASDVAGTYGKLSIGTDGKWTYTLDNDSKDVQALAGGATAVDKIVVQSFDGTEHTIEVTVNGTNDAAEIGGITSSTIVEDSKMSASGNLTINDKDTGEASFQAATADAPIKGTYGSLTINSAGNWTYTADAAAVQFLGEGKTVDDTITVKAKDGTTQDITITITGTNDAATFSDADTGSVTEDAIVNTATGTLVATDVDEGEVGFQAASDVAGKYGSLSIDADGKWTYTLDNTNKTVQALGNNVKIEDTITVKSFDGTTKDIKVTIVGTNDEASITGTTKGDVAEDGTAKASGKLDVADVDSGENTVASMMQKKVYGTFNIDTNGNWTYDIDNDAAQSLKQDQKVVEKFTVFSADNTASSTIEVTITGKNDVATFSGADTGSVTEDAIVNTATGVLKVTDVDTGEAVFKAATGIAGTYGSLAIDANGNWTYTLDNSKTAVQELAAGATASDKIKVASADGTEHTIEVTVTGVNDAAVIGGTKTGTVTEDNATTTATGTLTITDADKDQASFVAQTATKGTYGSLSIGTDGKWTYTLDNSSDAVNKLKGTDKVEDSFTVASKDGTQETIKIAVNGANDAPVINVTSGGLTATVAENNVATEIAKVVGVDVDSPTPTITLSGTDAAKFSFVNGTLTLNAGIDFEALPANDKILNVTLTAKDTSNATSTKDFAVTITNASDTYAISTSGSAKTFANFDESGPVIDKFSVTKSSFNTSSIQTGAFKQNDYQEISSYNDNSSITLGNSKYIVEFKGDALQYTGFNDLNASNDGTWLFAQLKDSGVLTQINTSSGWEGYLVAYQSGDAFVYYGDSGNNSTRLTADEVKLVAVVKGVAEGSLDYSHFTVV